MDPVLELLKALGAGNNAVCRKCRHESGPLSNALGPWLIPDHSLGPPKVVFVGKVARGDSMGEEISEFFEDVSGFGSDFISQSSWPYWSYTREILARVFGNLEEGLRQVGFTNLIKCNNGTTEDSTSESTKNYCVSENRFIWQELELLRPRQVVFYTARDYDDFIDEYVPPLAVTWQDHADRMIPVGDKIMPWWDRSFYDAEGCEILRFLRTGHPERKNREDYVAAVSNWILTPPPAAPDSKRPVTPQHTP